MRRRTSADRRTPSFRLAGALASGLLLAATLGWPSPSSAASFTVDSTADVTDAVAGDGSCDDGSGACTLRAAIQEANALAGADSINLPAGTYALSLAGAGEDAGATGDLDIFDDLTLTGADRDTTIIDGDDLDAVFHIDPELEGFTVTMSGLTIQNGTSSHVWGGGGILARGTLILDDAIVRDNVHTAAGGGGIAVVGGALTLTHSEITGNSAASGGGIYSGPGAEISISDTTISGNSCGSSGGAGMGHYGAFAEIVRTVISGNTVTSNGAAGLKSSGTGLVIEDSEIASNDGLNGVGGIEIHGGGEVTIRSTTIHSNHGSAGLLVRYSSSDVTLVDSTVSGNYGGLYVGGGIEVVSSGVLDLRNSTVAANSGPTSGVAGPRAGGITVDGTVRIRNSIVAGNSSATGQPDCLGTLVSEGYNLVRSLAGCTITGDTTGNVLGQSPRLRPLGDHGGPTPVHLPGTASPAIDAGHPDAPGSGGTACEALDQRGVARPLDGDGDGTSRCDIGAAEAANEALTFTVNTIDDANDGVCDGTHCSLREAILASNATSSGIDTIAFDIPGDGPHTIQPASALPTITDPVLVDGYTEPGASPNTNGPDEGSNAVLMIEIDGSAAGAAVSGLRISCGFSTIRGLAIGRFVRSAADGGNGIEITGTGGNRIEGCFLGTDPGGTLDRGNQNGGVFVSFSDDNVIGGTDPAARNVLSGNDDDEVRIYGSRNVVEGNFVGTNLGGTSMIGPGGGSGVRVGFGSDNLIGGDVPGAGNLITGQDYAIEVDGSATGTVIHGNVLGPLLGGQTAAAYSGRGVYVTQSATDTRIGGAGPGQGNLISGNDVGIQQNGSTVTGTVVHGNRIGTAADGVGPLGNGKALWVHRGTGLVFGGEGAGEANLVAYNGADPPFPPQPAIHLTGGSGTDVRANSIHSNLALAINLDYDGVTPNDPGDTDTGPNGLQNFPVLTAVASDGTSVDATLDSTASTDFRVDVYASSECDPSGYGEAESFVGSETVTTDGSGQAISGIVLDSLVPPGWFVTSTATDPDGNTSELSACLFYDPPVVDLALTSDDGDTSAVPGDVVVYTLAFANGGNTTATGVEITETVPDHATFAPASSTAGWTCLPDDGPGSTCTLAIGAVNAGIGGAAAFALAVDEPVDAGVESIADGASISDDGATGPDPVPGDNSASDSTPILAVPDLVLAKDDGGALPDPGGGLGYALTWTNDGNQGATGVTLTETVPDDVTFDPAASTAGWDCVPNGDPGSVCTLLVGEVAGGGAGGAVTFSVDVDSPIPPGTGEITNTASIADDGANGADPNPDDNDATVVTDAVAPRVVGVDSLPGTGDGALEECETVHGIAITALDVSFSEPLHDPPGDADPDDVTNPANYLLVAPGPDARIDTIACGAPAGDDVPLSIASVSWDEPTATSRIELAEALGDTPVRVLACGAGGLRDPSGRPLDGDGDGFGGDDFVRSFRSDPRNVFANGHLDCSLVDWTVAETVPGAVGWTAADADGANLSGSAEVLNPSPTGSAEAFALGQCVPLAAHRYYRLSLSVQATPEPGELLTLGPECELFDGDDCLGTSLGLSGDAAPVGDTADAWKAHRLGIRTPAGTLSGLCAVTLATDDSGPAFESALDRLRLTDETVVFEDDFESGNADAWVWDEP